LLIAPLGSAGTYAEYVVVTADAPFARVPDGLDDVVAAAIPTAAGTGLALVESLEPLSDKTVLIVGAGGSVGSFATQLIARARVIANVRTAAAERMRGYGATETIDHTEVSLLDAVRLAHPDGIDVLIDLVSDAEALRRSPRSCAQGVPPSAPNTWLTQDIGSGRSHGHQRHAAGDERAPRAGDTRPG
jgi:NADPH:quinone reductase-like Zn-dependent oxidoreductase